MRNVRLAMVLGLALTTVGGTARAADLCIKVAPNDSTQYVGRGFTIPGKGKCRAWNGVYLPSFANVSVTTGTGCTSSDGTLLRLHLTSMRQTVAFNDYVVLPLPSLTGGTIDEIVPQFGSSVLHIEGVSAAKCNPKDNPIP